jgi:hypothetical protein
MPEANLVDFQTNNPKRLDVSFIASSAFLFYVRLPFAFTGDLDLLMENSKDLELAGNSKTPKRGKLLHEDKSSRSQLSADVYKKKDCPS